MDLIPYQGGYAIPGALGEEITLGSSLTPEQQAALRRERWLAAAAENERVNRMTQDASRMRNVPATVARGAATGASRGGALGGVIGGVAAPFAADNEQDIAPLAALGGAGGYAAQRALPALRNLPAAARAVGRAVAPVARTLGRVAAPGLALAPGVMSVFEQPSVEQMASELGWDAPQTPGQAAMTAGVGAINRLTFGVPGFISRSLRGEPEQQAEPQATPALAPVDAEAVPNYVMMDRQNPALAPSPMAVEQAAQPALAPRAAPAQVTPQPAMQPATQQMPDFQSNLPGFMQRLDEEAARLEDVVARYEQQSGQVIPRELSKMDKFGILAKALGVGALVAAFPAFGILGGLGAGLLGGSSAYDAARGGLAADAEAQRQRLADNMKTRLDIGKQRMGALGDLMEVEQGREQDAYTRVKDARRFGLDQQREARLARQAQLEGSTLAVGDDGFYVRMFPDGRTVKTDVRPQHGALGGRSGVAYNPLEDVRGIADQLTPEYEAQLMRAAGLASQIGGMFNPGVPGAGMAPQQDNQLTPEGESLFQRLISSVKN